MKVTSVESKRNPCTIGGEEEEDVIADTNEIRAKKNPFCGRKVRVGRSVQFSPVSGKDNKGGK